VSTKGEEMKTKGKEIKKKEKKRKEKKCLTPAKNSLFCALF